MEPDEKLARWAALFVNACSDDDAVADAAGPPAATPAIDYSGVTQGACELLQAVDSGGVPAFVTGNLKRIAEDNGIVVTDEWTPNEIVEAIRSKASTGGYAGPERSG